MKKLLILFTMLISLASYSQIEITDLDSADFNFGHDEVFQTFDFNSMTTEVMSLWRLKRWMLGWDGASRQAARDSLGLGTEDDITFGTITTDEIITNNLAGTITTDEIITSNLSVTPQVHFTSDGLVEISSNGSFAIRLDSNATASNNSFRIRNHSNTSNLLFFGEDGNLDISGNLSLGGTITDPNHATTKDYVDGLITGSGSGNVSTAGLINNQVAVGSGPLTIDGSEDFTWDGATASITGDLNVNGPVTAGNLLADNLSSSSTDTDLTLSGDGTGGVVVNDDLDVGTNTISADNLASSSTDTDLTLSGSGTGEINLNDNTNITGDVGVSGALRIAGTEAISSSRTVDFEGGTIDNALIGGTTPAVGSFTELNAELVDVSTAYTQDGATMIFTASDNANQGRISQTGVTFDLQKSTNTGSTFTRFIRYTFANDNIALGVGTNHLLIDGTGTITTSGNILPSTDNARTLGNASFRMSEIFAANGTINTSDVRLKQNIEDYPSVLDSFMQLKPRTFESKYDDYSVGNGGFVADEVEQVFPQLVKSQPDTLTLQDGTVTIANPKTISINGPEMIAILVKAIQELEAKILELENN